jgi:hypothetical protein
MAEDPWAVKEASPLKSDDPWAVVSHESSNPSYMSDIAKSAGPAVIRGLAGVMSVPGTLEDMAQRGLRWGMEKVLPADSAPIQALHAMMEVDKNPQTGKSISQEHAFFPTYDTTLDKIEKQTGPLYEAKTGPGKAIQTGIEIAPSLLTGEAGVIPSLLRAGGAGAASELAGEAANKAKGILPTSVQPYAEPVARGLGVIGGAASPSIARRVVTPLPQTAEQAAMVSALRAKAPDFPLTAGQETGSPTVMSLEGRSGKFDNLPKQQEEAFTRGAMREMGVDGLATPENIAKGGDIGDEIGNIRRSGTIDTPEFQRVNREVSAIKRNLTAAAGKNNLAPFEDIQNEIRYGVAGAPGSGVAGISGDRYNYLRQKIQSAIDGAATGDEKTALSKVRQSLDDAFHRSIPADQSARLKNLETQYANYNVLKNKTPTGEDTVTPKEVRKAVAKGFGNAAVNENRGSLAPYARNAERAAPPLPPRNTEVSDITSLLGALGGAVSHGAAGYGLGGGMGALTGAGEGSLSGLFTIPHVVNAAKDVAGRVVSSGPAQMYLRKQNWLPGSNTAGLDKDALVRLLMSPPETKALGGASK